MPKTICLIDDEEDILNEVGGWLEDYGYRVMTATSGDEAMEKMRNITPHLVILDIIMPKTDGFEVLSQLKRNKETADIPVIMLTAKTETKTILQAQALQAADFFMKPFNTDELLRSIEKHA